jgi:hypothetical protein
LAAVVAALRVHLGNLMLLAAVLVEFCTTLRWLFPLAHIQLVLVAAAMAAQRF